MTNFSDLGLNPELLKALESEGYTAPTPIQAQAIPQLIAGRDLLGIAQTGTGKTAAFALPILHRLAANRKPAARRSARALVLSPTRELATQIAESFRAYGRHLGLTVTVVFGGVGHKPQMQALQRGVDVLVATPGRLIDHMNERNIELAATEMLVLDEADQMMDLGFIKPLRQIIAKLSVRRQSMFFSATMPAEIGQLASELLNDPVRVSVAPVAKTADRVAQRLIYVEQQKKRSLLVELFADAAMTRTLIFTRTKRGADRVARHLEGAGIPVAAIHGNKSQNQREAALEAFKRAKIRALVATDIAARGIDVDEVTHVVNFEIPNIPESYVHRIGRTARAGAEGIAISLVDNEERVYIRDIERLTKQQIPFEDRRNDAGLAAEARTPGEKHNGDVRREGRGGERRGGQGRGGEGRRSSGRQDHRGEARQDHRGEAREHNRGEARPEHRGEARPETRGEPRREGRPHREHADRGPRHDRPAGNQARGERRDHGRDGAERPQRHDNRGRADHASTERRGESRRDYVNELPFGAAPTRPYADRPKRDPDQAGEARHGRHDGHRPAHGGEHRGGGRGNGGERRNGHGRGEGRAHSGGGHRQGGRPASARQH